MRISLSCLLRLKAIDPTRQKYFSLLSGIVFVFITVCSSAQSTALGIDYNSFSDFHIHTTFKNYYRYIADPDSTVFYAKDPSFLNKKYGKAAWQSYTKNEKQ